MEGAPGAASEAREPKESKDEKKGMAKGAALKTPKGTVCCSCCVVCGWPVPMEPITFGWRVSAVEHAHC